MKALHVSFSSGLFFSRFSHTGAHGIVKGLLYEAAASLKNVVEMVIILCYNNMRVFISKDRF